MPPWLAPGRPRVSSTDGVDLLAPIHTVEAHVHAAALAVVGHDQHIAQQLRVHRAGVLHEVDLGTTRYCLRAYRADVRAAWAFCRRRVGRGPVGIAFHVQLAVTHADAQAVVTVLPVSRPGLQRRRGYRHHLQLAAIHPACAATHLVREERAAVATKITPGHHRIAT